ncbi:VOC family protein [Microbacterium sp. zg-YB36]|uniref:VOC family protein n=1 Tax=Microbacterium sp. zg-YB36 TaxID=2969407 RepID=UPI00214C2416|nr:VOC family protein [Microbacterium sp. zg-YB36]MDL5350914.1 VOC family protein [Microbacterium sp. zg-YB36]
MSESTTEAAWISAAEFHRARGVSAWRVQADVRPFFTAALGYEAFGDTDAVDPLRCGPQPAFNPITGDSPARGRTHFDVFVPADQAQARVDAALAAGGRLVDDSEAPAWWSLASPHNHGVDIASWTDTFD